MEDCLCNGPSIYDHYGTDVMKTSRQVITLNMTQALILPSYPFLLFSLFNKKLLACDVQEHSFSATVTASDFAVQHKREQQAIHPNCAWLPFQLSRCWAVLWITPKSWRERCVVESQRQTDTQSAQRDSVWDSKKHISFWRRDTWALEGRILWSATLTHEWNFSTESPASFSPLSVFLSVSSLCFGSILMHCLPNLAVEKRSYKESCWNVFMVDSVVRWLSQRRMLIRQPRLRLIWLAAVTPSSCSQPEPRLFLPLYCSTASSV